VAAGQLQTALEKILVPTFLQDAEEIQALVYGDKLEPPVTDQAQPLAQNNKGKIFPLGSKRIIQLIEALEALRDEAAAGGRYKS